jgi:PAS domain S-box-containing protein
MRQADFGIGPKIANVLGIEVCLRFEFASRANLPSMSSPDFLLSAIVKSCHDAIVSKTLDGIITSWNPGAEDMFAYPEDEVLGKSIRLIIPRDRQAEEDYILNQIRQGEKVDHFETVRLSKDGRRIDVSLTVSPILDAAGVIVGASKIARDISERKRFELEREQLLRAEQIAHSQLNDALKARDHFIAVAAHELRNPLQVIQLTLSLLSHAYGDSEKTSRTVELLHKIDVQHRRLSSLVDRLLDVTLAQSGTLGLRSETFDLSVLIAEVAERFRAERPAPSLDLELEPGIHGVWDRLRLEQVLTNLVSNAIKYGLQKPVLITASLHGERAVVKVRDEGTGIESESLPRMFDIFGRSPTESSVQQGLGIGLWITKRIVEEHRGTLLVHSAPGKGSTFIVELPLHAQL